MQPLAAGTPVLAACLFGVCSAESRGDRLVPRHAHHAGLEPPDSITRDEYQANPRTKV